MKRKDSVLLEQAYLKVLKEDSEMDFLAQQDPREANPLMDEDNLDVNSEYEKHVDEIVEKIQDAIVEILPKAEMDLEVNHPKFIQSGKFYTDVITKLTDRLKLQSR
jgi:hypothetical protein